jgi:hypothetical protein
MTLFVPALAVLMAPSAPAGTHDFPVPADDRWHYPYNFTPGTRGLAPCFSAVGNVTFPTLNDRDGMFYIAWDTGARIETGLCPLQYAVEQVVVTLTHVPGAAWIPDLTVDEWYTFDVNNDGGVNRDGHPRGSPLDRDGESNDVDPGRPLELFGVGFGPQTFYSTWRETAPYFGANENENRPRDPFPFVFQSQTRAILHVEDSVRGAHNGHLTMPVGSFTPRPWAIGVPQNYTPGRQDTPFAVGFTVDLDGSEGAVRRYFQEQLRFGRVVVAVTSMQETVIFGGGQGEYATFYTKEGVSFHPAARAPSLSIVLGRAGPTGDANGNCTVDSVDAAALLDCLLGPGMLPPMSEPCLSAFDFDRDDDVDLRDASVFMNRFGDE